MADVTIWPAALVVAVVALILGLMALLRLVVWPTARASAAGTQSDDTPVRPLWLKTAPSLAMKRPLLSAFLLAVALEVMAPGSSSEKKECAR